MGDEALGACLICLEFLTLKISRREFRGEVCPVLPAPLRCNASRAVVRDAPNNIYMSGARESRLFTDPGGKP